MTSNNKNTEKSRGAPCPRITRILEGDKGVRQVAYFGFILGKAPEDGYLIENDQFIGGSIYIRDSDLAAARKARKKSNRPVAVDAESWTP